MASLGGGEKWFPLLHDLWICFNWRLSRVDLRGTEGGGCRSPSRTYFMWPWFSPCVVRVARLDVINHHEEYEGDLIGVSCKSRREMTEGTSICGLVFHFNAFLCHIIPCSLPIGQRVEEAIFMDLVNIRKALLIIRALQQWNGFIGYFKMEVAWPLSWIP